jgi:hypothetical protein
MRSVILGQYVTRNVTLMMARDGLGRLASTSRSVRGSASLRHQVCDHALA